MPVPLSIAFVMEDLCFGGTQRQLLELARRLDRKRFSPTMITLTGATDMDALAHEACGSWRELAMSYILGRSLWGGKRAYSSVMKTTADVLLSDPKSPWVRYPW